MTPAQVEDLVQERVEKALKNLKVLGIAELATRWKVTKQRADQLANKSLPEPWRRPAMGRLWTEQQIEDFEKTWKRKTGIHR